eukprot:363392_1
MSSSKRIMNYSSINVTGNNFTNNNGSSTCETPQEITSLISERKKTSNKYKKWFTVYIMVIYALCGIILYNAMDRVNAAHPIGTLDKYDDTSSVFTCSDSIRDCN